MDNTFFNPTHQGFVDALQGKDPNPVFDRSDSYAEGWLVASELSPEGKAHWLKAIEIAESRTVKRGSQIVVPKGTTLQGGDVTKRAVTVTLHDVYYHQAYVNWSNEFTWPRANALWAGSGGYWKEASLADVILVAPVVEAISVVA